MLDFKGFAPQEDREAEIRRWMQHRGTPPIVASPEWNEAQRRLAMGGGNPLAMLVQQLTQMAGQRRRPTLRDYSGDGINPYVRQRNPHTI